MPVVEPCGIDGVGTITDSAGEHDTVMNNSAKTMKQ